MDFFVLVFLINISLGMMLNGFIVWMNCKSMVKNQRLSTGDTIITSLCLSRLIYQGLLCVYNTLTLFVFRAQADHLRHFISLGLIFLNYISIWFASLLCLFYWMKITNYHHPLFLYLKAKISKLVPGCLGLCVCFSLLTCLPNGWQVFSSPITKDSFQNTTKKTAEGIHVYFIGSSPPFVVFTIAFFLTVPSLWRHIRNMSGYGATNPDLKTHYNAIKSMTFFFLLHMSFIVCINVNLAGVGNYGVQYKSLMTMLASFYAWLHSAVIIFYNRQLRRGILMLFICRRGNN